MNMSDSTHNGEGESPLQHPSSIIAIDLGETTGLAYYNTVGNCLTSILLRSVSDVLEVVRLIDPELIILEKFPNTRQLTTDVETAYLNLCTRSNILLVSPGEWKPVMHKIAVKYPAGFTVHEKDASDLMRFYFWWKFRRDIRWNIK